VPEKAMSDFFRRLRERKLVQWALAYAAAAFALIQVADIVGQRFGWPDQVMRIIIVVAAIGLFVTLVVAWYHGERGAQRMSGTELMILALLLTIGGAVAWKLGPTAPKSAESTATSAPNGAAVLEKSIAVLPLANESGNKDEQYFSDGLSEDLITALSQFAGLKVISRNSSFQFRDSTDDARTIAAKLGVAHLLEGSVRRGGDAVRISAELVNAADASTLWSQHYDRPYKDLFALQDDITRAVADALKAKLIGTATQSDRPRSGNLAAYSAYQQGQFDFFQHTGEDAHKAVAHYTEAIRLDPGYALAYAALALSQAQLITIFSTPDRREWADLVEHARSAATTALSLQPELGKAHQARGFVLQVIDFDLAGAQGEYRRAAELAPQDATVQLNLGVVSASFGRLDEAAAYGQSSTTLDPLNSLNYIYLARSLIALGRYDEAEAAVHKAIEAHPRAAQSYSELAVIEILRGDAAAALRFARQETDGFWRSYAVALALFVDGDRAGADAELDNLLSRYADSGAFQIAQVYALRKQPDEMFLWLERGLAVRDPGVTTLRYAVFVKDYATDARFAALCKKMGLP
jgi:TolB-like protein